MTLNVPQSQTPKTTRLRDLCALRVRHLPHAENAESAEDYRLHGSQVPQRHENSRHVKKNSYVKATSTRFHDIFEHAQREDLESIVVERVGKFASSPPLLLH